MSVFPLVMVIHAYSPQKLGAEGRSPELGLLQASGTCELSMAT